MRKAQSHLLIAVQGLERCSAEHGPHDGEQCLSGNVMVKDNWSCMLKDFSGQPLWPSAKLRMKTFSPIENCRSLLERSLG